MKVTKEFAPVTIVLETRQELADLLEVLSAASAYYSSMKPNGIIRDKLEQLYIFGKVLK